MNAQPKTNPEIIPLPHKPDNSPQKNPEIIPHPDKSQPYHPLPEIKPNKDPEIKPNKERLG